MVGFGTTVSSYNKKPSSALNSFATKAVQPLAKPVSTLGVEQPKASTQQPLNSAAQPQSTDPTKSAVSGGQGIQASGLIGTVPGNAAQLYDSGTRQNIRSVGGEYKVLDALDKRTQLLNDEMDAKVSAFNQRAQRSNASNQYNGAGYEFDIGDGSGLDNEQMNNARQIAAIGRQRGLGDNEIQIAIMTALAESRMKNISHGDRDSVGLFQQRTSQGWGSVQQIMDPNYSINKFYDSLGKVNYKAMTPWQAAQAVQRSFDPTGGNYQAQYASAQKAFQNLTPKQQAAIGGTNASSDFINQYNNKYLDYDGAYGAQCVDLYNFYVTKFAGGDPMMGRVGYAADIFNNYDSRVFNRLGNNQSGRMGDVAVFNFGPGTPSPHVAIVVGDNGNGTLRVLQSNAGPGGSAGNSIISNISKSTLMGYLRPNKLG
jgi:hypothetical protein